MIRISNVTKRYGAQMALDGLTLEIPDRGNAPAVVFGLLGPNASGKSTLIKLLMGFIFPDRGRIDRGALAVRRIGYVPERPQLPVRASLRECVRLAGQLSDLQGVALDRQVDRALQQVGLSAVASTPVRASSKGMLQRAALAQAIVDDPPFLLLDEPMEGLDPAGQKEMRDLISARAQAGSTVLFSTHRLDHVTELCTHIAILSRGKLVRAGTLAEALPLRSQVTIVVDRLPDGLAARVTGLRREVSIAANTITLTGPAVACKPDVLRLLLDAGCDIQNVSQARATLEEVYLEAIRS